MAEQINDLMVATLTGLGYTGNYNDSLKAYFSAQGYTGALDDMWKQFLAAKGYTTVYDYLGSLGHTGTLNDRIRSSLVAGDFFGNVPVFSAAVMDATTGEMLLQDVGTGTPTSTHTSTIYMEDHEGVFRPFAANVPVWQGGRVVTNNVGYTESLGDGTKWTEQNSVTVTDGIDDPKGGTKAVRLTAGATSSRILRAADTAYNGEGFVRISVWVRRVSGTGNVFVYGTASPLTIPGATLPTTWTRYSHCVAYGSFAVVYLQLSTSGDVVEFAFPMLEYDNSLDNVPSEYTPRLDTSINTKTFGTENGNSVVSNVVTEARGADLAQKPWLRWQPLGTNSLTYSRDLTNAAWTKSSLGSSYDQTGITGVANTATQITDADAAATRYARQTVSISDDSATHTMRVWVAKDADQSRFPELVFFCFGGTGQIVYTQLNTETGAHAVRSATGTPTYATEVIDDGDWWVFLIELANNSSGNTTLYTDLYPASSTTWGTVEVAAQGSIIVGNAEVYLNKTIAEVRGLGPIFTTSAAASTDALAPAYDGSNIDDDNGAVYVEWKPSIADTEATGDIEILSTTTGASLIYYDATANQFETTDGTNTVSAGGAITADTAYQVGLIWDAAEGKMRLSVDGTWGTEGTYDGAFTGSDLDVGRASSYASAIRNMQGHTGSYSSLQTVIEGLMA